MQVLLGCNYPLEKNQNGSILCTLIIIWRDGIYSHCIDMFNLPIRMTHTFDKLKRDFIKISNLGERY